MIVANPPLKYHGGKTYLAEWIRSLAPPSSTYTHRVIGCAGGLGEFWNWPCENVSEVVNDISLVLTNFYRVLQDERTFGVFQRKIEAVAMSRDEFMASILNGKVWHDKDVTAALAFFIKFRQSRQGLGKCFATLSKTRTRRGMNEQASSWLSAIEGLPEAHERLKRVVIENLPIVRLIRQEDSPVTLFYIDPPYPPEVRVTTDDYEFEMTREQHIELLETLVDIEGKFMLSGYHCPFYDQIASLCKWTLHEREIDNKASAKRFKEKRIECLWTNYQTL